MGVQELEVSDRRPLRRVLPLTAFGRAKDGGTTRNTKSMMTIWSSVSGRNGATRSQRLQSKGVRLSNGSEEMLASIKQEDEGHFQTVKNLVVNLGLKLQLD